MKISKIGEFGLIELIKKMLKNQARSVSIGDDCAALPFDRRYFLLFTCDMLIENVDFTKKDRLYLVGRKSVGVSLSDIAACAGLPLYAQISLGLSAKMSVSQVKELYRGILSEAGEFKVKVVGGDISSADKLIIDASIIGMVERRNLVRRTGARKADTIFISGKLGGSIYSKHLKFKPRVNEARYLVKNYKINSMIDISDGLIQDLGHILRQSNKGAVLFKDSIPVSSEARSFDEALYMGEDFELLFTLSPSEAKKLSNSRQPYRFYPIGEIIDEAGGLILLDKNAKKIKIKPVAGFKHF